MKRQSALLSAAKACPLPEDPNAAWIEAGDWGRALDGYAKMGCRAGTKGEYWTVWVLIQSESGLSLEQALQMVPVNSARWLALWARERGNLELFLQSYELFLTIADHRKVGPIAHENSLFFEGLFQRRMYSKISAIVEALFAPLTGNLDEAGYLYENAWLAISRIAVEPNDAEEVVAHLISQFPKEGTALLCAAMLQWANGLRGEAKRYFELATKCSYIEPAIMRSVNSWLREKGFQSVIDRSR
jgi:hypothetical protein